MKKIIITILFALFVFSLNAFPNKEVMNSKVGNVPLELQNSVFKNPKENLPALVNYLVQGSKDVSGKVRVIHDWICNNITYDTEMYFSGRSSKQDEKTKGIMFWIFCSISRNV